MSPVSGFPAIVAPAGFTREVYDRVPDANDPNDRRLEGPKPDQLPATTRIVLMTTADLILRSGVPIFRTAIPHCNGVSWPQLCAIL